jgi:phytoene desaturase
MPDGLKEIIKIHTLNAGVAPNETIALYASMAAIMANNGVSIPRGGINEIPQAIAKLATHAGAEIRLSEAAVSLSENNLTTTKGSYEFDFCVASVDSEVLARLLGKKPKSTTKYSCSGVAIYAVFSEPLDTTEMHSVVMPDNPDAMHRALGRLAEPEQTMAFVNYYPKSEIYPGEFDSAAILLTAPANGKHYEFDSDWVQKQLSFISEKLGEDLASKISEVQILDPKYFSGWGSIGGALYGSRKPFWRSGPFHTPSYKNSSWLYRVGAEVHPGGGIPAVLGGALIATGRMPN